MAFLSLLSALPGGLRAADWPTYRHDNRRSGITPEPVPLPLEPAWTYRSPTPPQTAWSGPAKWDAYASLRGLESMRNFDPAFFVTAVGDSVQETLLWHNGKLISHWPGRTGVQAASAASGPAEVDGGTTQEAPGPGRRPGE